MPNMFMKLLFKSDYDYYSRLEGNFDLVCQQRNEFEIEILDLKKCIDKIVQLNRSYRIISVSYDKYGEIVILYSHPEKLDIYLKSLHSRYHSHDLSLFLKYSESDKSMFIQDIQMSKDNVNKGYGSLVMNELFTVVENLGIKQIRGSISHVDWVHIDRLKHFYEKFNFEVLLHHESQRGSIKWVK